MDYIKRKAIKVVPYIWRYSQQSCLRACYQRVHLYPSVIHHLPVLYRMNALLNRPCKRNRKYVSKMATTQAKLYMKTNMFKQQYYRI